MKAQKKLEQLRKTLQNEDISYGEIAELRGLGRFIEDGDVELLEPAGVPEGEKGGHNTVDIISALAFTIAQGYDQDTIENVCTEIGIEFDNVEEYCKANYEDVAKQNGVEL